jgi:hypothetical protein
MEIINQFFRRINFEVIAWCSALLILFFINPHQDHYSFCLFHNLGIDFCPGCGLGRGINHLLHLNFSSAFNTHPLSYLAVPVLLHRIFKLTIGKNQTISY